jgi:hypothetical protein
MPIGMLRRRPCVVAGFLVTLMTQAQAQLPPNPAYDGRPTLARLRYTALQTPPECLIADGLGSSAWSHDYPASVKGLLKASTELTSIEAPADSVVTLAADDPVLLKHPVAMVTEPGCWNPTDKEVQALRVYLLKGGFLIVDDMVFGDGSADHLDLAIQRFEKWMQRVLPENRLVPIPASDPIFDGFFRMDLQAVPGYGTSQATGGQLYGIYADNNPTKRLMVVASYRGILGHYWRWNANDLGSGVGSQAYRLGLNYFIYGLSH